MPFKGFTQGFTKSKVTGHKVISDSVNKNIGKKFGNNTSKKVSMKSGTKASGNATC